MIVAWAVVVVLCGLLAYSLYKFGSTGVELLTGRDRQGSFGGYPQQSALTGLDRIREDYALGKMTTGQMVYDIDRYLSMEYGLPPPDELPALPEPALRKPADPYANIRAKLLADVKKYQREETKNEQN